MSVDKLIPPPRKSSFQPVFTCDPSSVSDKSQSPGSVLVKEEVKNTVSDTSKSRNPQ